MKRKYIQILVLVLMLAGLIPNAQPAFAQASIPGDAVITSATLSLYVHVPSGQTVRIHQVTGAWTEGGVTWNNFGGAFDAAVAGSFVADSLGYHTVDLTALVQDWVDGTPNYGIYIEQDLFGLAMYHSSEEPNEAVRPKLDICYTSSSGSDCFTIQNVGGADDVLDAWIWEMYPDANGGNSYLLFTGVREGGAKQSLLQFNFDVTPPPPSEGWGCTPGYWKQKQHFDSWVNYAPGDNYFAVFGTGFDDGLLGVLKTGGGGEAALGRHSVAALLNAASPDVDYAYTEAEIIQMVQDAFASGDFESVKNLFEYENELGCPLN